MAIRDILVHLDPSPASTVRLDLAAELARRLSAHLVGLHVVDVPLPAFVGAEMGGAAFTAELMTGMRDAALADARAVEERFQARIRHDGLAGEWRQPEGVTAAQVPLHARYADLAVIGQEDPDMPGLRTGPTIEATLFASGRPVLVVPYAWRAAAFGRRALVGWNASRESARAVHDALPLLAGSESVTVLSINAEASSEGHGEEPGADIARHLARHGLKVSVRRVAGGDIQAGDILLNEAADLGADLIVMGGYGHSRLRELVLGGATRTILRQMTVPVLLSH